MVSSKKKYIILGSIATFVVVSIVVGVTVGVLVGKKKSKDQAVEQRVQDILTENPLIDGHNDWAWLIRENFRNNLTNLDLYDMTQYPLKNSTPTHTDITRLRKGQVGGQFWSIYTGCGHQGKDATISFMEQIDLMNRLLAKHKDVFQMTRTANEVREAFQAKRIASLYGMESGQAIESSFAVLRLFYQLGVRYMTLTHNCNTPWADQNQVDRVNSTLIRNNGLTPFGRKVIAEMNRLGMLVDLSHVSKKTMLDVLNVTQSPVIFSHSSAWALCNHTRNVQDDVLRLVRANGGVVMVAFTPGFITCDSSYLGAIPDVAAHINHIRQVAGVESVGIGADYDGIDQTPIGLGDVSTYPKLIEYLLSESNWSSADIIKLIGGNILRVIERNEEIARELQERMEPLEDQIPQADLIKFNLTQCRVLDMNPKDTNA